MIGKRVDMNNEKMQSQKPKPYAQGMYDELPKVVIGDFIISEFNDPPDDMIWISRGTGKYEGEGMAVSKDLLSKTLDKFYEENF